MDALCGTIHLVQVSKLGLLGDYSFFDVNLRTAALFSSIHISLCVQVC